MIHGAVDLYDPVVGNHVSASGVPMLAVGYRRAPEHPHPVPVEDSYTGLQWLAHHAAELGVDPAITPFLVWSNDDNNTGWGALLGEGMGGATVPVYAAPARVADPAGLPPTYMEVGTLDLFRDEDIGYARRLNAAAVPTELRVHPGAPHAVEAIAPGAGVSTEQTQGQSH